MTTENKYKRGEIVFDKIRPSQKLIVDRYAHQVYYCKVVAAPHRKPLLFMERDLYSDEPLKIRINNSVGQHPGIINAGPW